MLIHLDDQPLTLDTDHAPDLRSVLAAARDRLTPNGRVVVEVWVDGQNLAGQDLERHQATPVDGSDVRLLTADARQIAADALNEVRLVLHDAKDAQTRAADLFQRDNAADATQALASAFDAWHQAHHAVSSTTALLGLDLADVSLDDQPVAHHVAALADQLRHLKELIHNRDTVALADALEYEWADTADLWDRLMAQIADHIADAPRDPTDPADPAHDGPSP